MKPAMFLTVAGGLSVIQVKLAENVFVFGEVGSTGLGIMFAIMGVGTGLSPICARYFTGDDDRKLRIAIFWAFILTSVGLVIAATLRSFPVVLFGLLIRGFGGGIIWVFTTQLLMQAVPDRMRGRVFSTEFAMFALASSISTGFTGYCLDIFNISYSGILLIMAFLSIIPGVFWLLKTGTKKIK